MSNNAFLASCLAGRVATKIHDSFESPIKRQCHRGEPNHGRMLIGSENRQPFPISVLSAQFFLCQRCQLSPVIIGRWKNVV